PNSPNFNNSRLADSRNGAEFTQNFRRNFLVHVDDADSFLRLLHAAEGEVGDIDFVLPEQRADAADDAGDILIANQEQEALERRLDIDVVHAEDTQRTSQPNHAQNGGGLTRRPQGHAERIRVRGAARAAHFDHLDPARLGQVSRVDQVDLLGQDLAEDAFQDGVLHQVRVQIRQAPVVTDRDFRDWLWGQL